MYTALILVFVAAVGYVLFRPLFSGDDGEDEIRPLLTVAAANEAVDATGVAGAIATESANKEAVYATLAELEYDYATHKLAEEDYRMLKAGLEAKALEIIRREEAVEAEILREVERADTDLDAAIEAEVRAESAADRETPAGPAAAGEVRFCPGCGARLLSSGQRFCHRCGAHLPTPEAEPCDA